MEQKNINGGYIFLTAFPLIHMSNRTLSHFFRILNLFKYYIADEGVLHLRFAKKNSFVNKKTGEVKNTSPSFLR